MSGPDYLTRLREINQHEHAASENCINRGKDFTHFTQAPPSAEKLDFSEADSVEVARLRNATHAEVPEFQRERNQHKNALSPNCINPVKGFTQFVQFAPGAKNPDPSEADAVRVVARAATVMTVDQDAQLRTWLRLIGESDVEIIEGLLGRCRADQGALSYHLSLAAAALGNDLRTCSQCGNLKQRVCTVASSDPLAPVVAIKGYRPHPARLIRCEGFVLRSNASNAVL